MGCYDKFQVDMSPAPRPFPGRYPTRVVVKSLVGKSFYYEGKPVNLAERVKSQFFKRGGNTDQLSYTEFDQNGIVLSVAGGRVISQATFMPLYWPESVLLGYDLSRTARTCMTLARTLRQVAGKRIYTCKFWDELNTPGIQLLMLNDCARGKFKIRWFPHDFIDSFCYTVMPRLTAIWLQGQAVVQQTTVRPIAFAPPPTRARTLTAFQRHLQATATRAREGQAPPRAVQPVPEPVQDWAAPVVVDEEPRRLTFDDIVRRQLVRQQGELTGAQIEAATTQMDAAMQRNQRTTFTFNMGGNWVDNA